MTGVPAHRSPAPAVRGGPDRRAIQLSALAAAALFLVIYLPDAGHGFISDDFRWIVEGRLATPADLVRVFTSNVGFYRPVVTLSFGLDYALWGDNARGYGVTNLALCLAGAWTLYVLARRLGLAPAASLVAAAAWLFNFHAVNMALLWLSGRTALLVTLFALATAHAIAGGRTILAAAACFLALLSKEEAVALPAFFTAAHLVEGGRMRGVARLLPLWAALGLYLALRWYSGAFWAGDAPSFYRFTVSPALLLRNVAEYADRAATVGAVVAIALVGATRVRRADLSPEEARALRFGALWIPAAFALTVALPVRSSLYALLPSIGTALVVGSIASAAQRAAPGRFARTALGLLVIVALLVPVYRSRNERWVGIAEVSARTMQTVGEDTAGRPPGHIVLVDAPEERFNLASAFGNLFPEALRLRTAEGWTGEIVSSPAEAPAAAELVYRLENGGLSLVRRAGP